MTTKRDFTWRNNELFFGRRKAGEIVQDQTWPVMWRVKQADGSLTDMVNRTRAKDAAMSFALREIDRRYRKAGR